MTLRYVDNIDAIMAAEREARKQLQTGTLLINGKTLNIQYSLQDMGELKHLFDNDLNTVMRTMEANPLKVNAAYQQDQKTRSIALKIGGNASRVKIDLLDKDGRPIYSDERTYDETPDPRVIQFNFDEMLTFRSFNLEVESLHSPEPAHVHLWEIMILENQDE